MDVTTYVSRMQTEAADTLDRIEEKRREGALRALLTRIKNARISRGARDNLSLMVRDLAENDRLDGKAIKGVLDIVFLHEMTGRKADDRDRRLLTGEKSVDDELNDIRSARAAKKEQRQRLDDLRNAFSVQV